MYDFVSEKIMNCINGGFRELDQRSRHHILEMCNGCTNFVGKPETTVILKLKLKK
jgi:hypothetical protein